MILRITAKPGARKNAVQIDAAGQITIRIAAPAVDGKANAALQAYLSELLQVPKTRIVIEKGTGNRFKTISIEAPAAEVIERLSAAAAVK